jgi:hypothetical protein
MLRTVSSISSLKVQMARSLQEQNTRIRCGKCYTNTRTQHRRICYSYCHSPQSRTTYLCSVQSHSSCVHWAQTACYTSRLQYPISSSHPHAWSSTKSKAQTPSKSAYHLHHPDHHVDPHLHHPQPAASRTDFAKSTSNTRRNSFS